MTALFCHRKRDGVKGEVGGKTTFVWAWAGEIAVML